MPNCNHVPLLDYSFVNAFSMAHEQQKIVKACAWDDGKAVFVYQDGSVFVFTDEMNTFVVLSPSTNETPQGRAIPSCLEMCSTAFPLQRYVAPVAAALRLYNRFSPHPRMSKWCYDDEPAAVFPGSTTRSSSSLLLAKDPTLLERRVVLASVGSHVGQTQKVPVGEEVHLWCRFRRVRLTVHWHEQLFTVRWPAELEGSQSNGGLTSAQKESSFVWLEQVFPVNSPPPVWSRMLSLALEMWAEAKAEDKQFKASNGASDVELEENSVAGCQTFTSILPRVAQVGHPWRFLTSLRPSDRSLFVASSDIAIVPCVASVKMSSDHSDAPSEPSRWLWQWCAADPSGREPACMFWSCHTSDVGSELLAVPGEGEECRWVLRVALMNPLREYMPSEGPVSNVTLRYKMEQIRLDGQHKNFFHEASITSSTAPPSLYNSPLTLRPQRLSGGVVSPLADIEAGDHLWLSTALISRHKYLQMAGDIDKMLLQPITGALWGIDARPSDAPNASLGGYSISSLGLRGALSVLAWHAIRLLNNEGRSRSTCSLSKVALVPSSTPVFDTIPDSSEVKPLDPSINIALDPTFSVLSPSSLPLSGESIFDSASHLSIEVACADIKGIGHFSAWRNAVVRCRFEDRTLLTLIPAASDDSRILWESEDHLMANFFFRNGETTTVRVESLRGELGGRKSATRSDMLKYLTPLLQFRRHLCAELLRRRSEPLDSLNNVRQDLYPNSSSASHGNAVLSSSLETESPPPKPPSSAINAFPFHLESISVSPLCGPQANPNDLSPSLGYEERSGQCCYNGVTKQPGESRAVWGSSCSLDGYPSVIKSTSDEPISKKKGSPYHQLHWDSCSRLCEVQESMSRTENLLEENRKLQELNRALLSVVQ